MAKSLDQESVKLAVQIAVAAAPLQAGSIIDAPESVAKFIEVVATKINDLVYPN